MKKTVSILLALVLAAALTACGEPAQPPAASGNGGADNGAEAAQELESEIGGEITVSCYDTMEYQSFLEEAAKKFEAKYPGTKVNVETFSSMPEVKTMEDGDKMVSMMVKENDEQEKADYISKVNTELMSGGGADVLAIDVIPFYRYAENGQLIDLSGYMAEDTQWNDADYRKNILDAIKYNGGTYFLPISYSFDYFAYDGTLLDSAAQQKLDAAKTLTYEQLFDIAAASFESNGGAGQESKVLGFTGYGQRGEGLFSELMTESFTSFVDVAAKKASFDDGRFAALLESVKEYDSKGYLKADMASAAQSGDVMEFGRNKDERYYYKLKNNFSLMQHFNKDSGRNMVISFGSSATGNEDDDKLCGLPTNAKGEIPFSFSQAYGINANSANKQTAWAFIKFLLSEEMQTSTGIMIASLPVNNNARAEQMRLAVSGALFSRAAAFASGPDAPEGQGGGIKRGPGAPDGQEDGGAAREPKLGEPDGPQGGPIMRGSGPDAQNPPVNVELDETQQAVYEKYAAQAEAYSDLLNACPVKDATIEAMIRSEAKYFFDGARSADEVAKALQSKVGLYLNE